MGGAIQVVLTSLKMGTIAVIVIAGVAFGKQRGIEAAPQVTHLGVGTIGGLLTALVPAMWAYNGFTTSATLVKKLPTLRRTSHEP